MDRTGIEGKSWALVDEMRIMLEPQSRAFKDRFAGLETSQGTTADLHGMPASRGQTFNGEGDGAGELAVLATDSRETERTDGLRQVIGETRFARGRSLDIGSRGSVASRLPCQSSIVVW